MRITEFYKQIVNSMRNIFILIYSLHIGYLSSCRTDFDNVETRALLSQIVVVAKIINLSPAPPDSSRDYNFNIATIIVTSVLKAPNTTDYSVVRRSSMRVDGFLPYSNTFNSSQPTMTNSRNDNQLGSQTLSETAEQHCLSIVQKNSEYILFINHTTDRLTNLFQNAQPAQFYTKSDKNRIKDVLCENCATEPNAKAKRKIKVTQGASNYKLTCRVTGNPEPEIRWYKNGEELTSKTRGIHIKPVRKRRRTYSISIRIKKVLPEHAGTYKCVARSIKGYDSAKSTLTVIESPSVSTGSQQQTTESVRTYESEEGDEDKTVETDLSRIENDMFKPVSHYVPCTGRDQYYCLNGGQCRIRPDGQYKHCRCGARFTGSRCEEADLAFFKRPKPTKPFASTRPITATDSTMELGTIIIILACALAAAIFILCLLCFCVAGWFYGRLKFRRSQISREKKLDEVDCIKNWSPAAKNNNLAISTGTQTDPALKDPIRNSVDLINHFPRTSSDASLRQSNSRPNSQSDWRQRSRLSGLSTLNPAARPPALSPPEEEPSTVTNPVQECLEEMERFLASHAPDSIVDNHNNNYTPKAHCDPSAANTSEPVSLHISEQNIECNNSTLSDKGPKPKSTYYDLYNGYLLGKQNNTEHQIGS